MQVAGAFVRIGLLDARSYPMALLMKAFGLLVPVVTFYFVAQLVVVEGEAVGYDYYTFVMIGVIALAMLDVGLRGFANQLQVELSYGRLEMYLTEPIRWQLLPVVMVIWPLLSTFVLTLGMVALSVLLGANYVATGIVPSFVIVGLGLTASLSIGVTAAAVRVLAKRADPVLAIYTLAASVFSGVFYPVSSMPESLQKLALLIPHTYAIQALRRVLMPSGDVLPGPTTSTAVVALAIFSVVAYPAGLWLYGRSMNLGRKLGILTGY